MPLKDYEGKRDFDSTTEPSPGKESSGAIKKKNLAFVVQKHYASRLHYDLRLELENVLKSWAVPKGPSLDPADKHLSVMVEDHPLDYKDFSGIIPEGNYGAGKVEIWDKGTYHSLGSEDREGAQEEVKAGLEKGHVTIILEGEKLNGEFALIKLKKAKDNNWLLIKKNDDYAVKGWKIEQDKSPGKKKIKNESILEKLPRLKGIKKVKAIPPYKPMLATLTNDAFDHDDWIFEIKWDGYRAMAQVDEKGANIFSRNMKNYTGKFDPIRRSLEKIGYHVLLDGEIVITDSKGRSDFSGLTRYIRTGIGNPLYYVFDLLYINGYSLLKVPLIERKAILEEILPMLPNIKISSHIEKTGKAFFAEAVKNDLEGIIAKKESSSYAPALRSRDWLKIKIKQTQDVVIGGYIKGQGNKFFRSIAAGVYQGKKLIHIGNIGGGFSQDISKDLFERLKKIITSNSPFSNKIKDSQIIVWVKPEIVAEVEFSEWTPDGYLRHPVFKTIKDEEKPSRVVRENALLEIPEEDDKSFKGKLSNPGKVFWPDEGYTKKDLFAYYEKVSDFILPHLAGRLQSLHRHPDGINGESFFQKNINFRTPSWIETFQIHDKKRKKAIRYLVCRNVDSLLYMVNLGCIEINPWLSRIDKIDNPDFVLIDLDPEGTDFRNVVSTALKTREILEMLDIKSFVKTSGATGLHIYIPTGSAYDFSQTLQFANMLVIIIKRKIPGISSIERSPQRRQGKVYLDYLQNRRSQTIAAPYSVRPRPTAPVSTPLFWHELESLRDPSVFNIKSIFERLEEHGDIWKDMYNKSLDMEKVISNIQDLYKDLFHDGLHTQHQ